MIAASVMLAVFMVVLDTSVANVALPHIAGNLSAATDESTWVLTSYLVSSAIMLPASSWIARRLGRRRLLVVSIGVFTGASVLCGMAANLQMLIAARVLQGVGGGSMLPLAQAILLESFPPSKHAVAMAAYGAGVVVAPVIGPTLGGWITDNFSWRWLFYINLPVGAVAIAMARTFIHDPPYLRRPTRGVVDFVGFGLMALWLGSLQLVLDKGQEADWFGASWICWMSVFSVLALAGFLVWEFRQREPIVQMRVLGNRNFWVGTVITCLYGFVLYGAIALLPLFLQTLMGYPALDSGLAVSPRGIGSIVSTVAAGYLASRIDGRILLAFGFGVFGVSILMLCRVNLEISMISIVLPNLLNGFAGGFIFVPLTTMTMGRLHPEEMGNAAGIYNLMRNLGGSVGIAVVTTFLVRGAQFHQTHLGASVIADSPVVLERLHGIQVRLQAGGADLAVARARALALMYGTVKQQAALMAYLDNFRILGWLSLACIPFALLFRKVRRPAGDHSEMAGEP
jgi:DHA2 family multidrug resistance protein